MSDSGSQEKTEQATPKKLEDSRQKGQVAHSRDINTAVILILSFLYLWIGWEDHMQSFAYLMGLPGQLLIMPFDSAWGLMFGYVKVFWQNLMVPFLIIVIAGSLIGAFLVVGPVFSMDPIKPDFNKLNPVTGFKRLFSLKSLFETLKAFVVFLFFCFAFYIVTLISFQYINSVSRCGFNCFVEMFATLSLWLIAILLVILLLVGAFDYILQQWLFLRDMRMTKDEIKREHKNREGDPTFKSHRKQLGKEIVESPPLDVSKASIVITAGSRIAVALYYKQDETPLPLLVAKAAETGASKIVAKARSSNVKVAENPDLARQLFEELELGGYLKEHQIQPVAQFMGSQGV